MPGGYNQGWNYPRLTSSTQISGADLIYIFCQQNGGVSASSLTLFAEWLSDNITVTGDGMVTQYSAPSATGFTATITDSDASAWLILTPVATYAAGTIVLPSFANSADKQEVLVNCTQIVTALTVSSSGATVTGAPTTLAANGFFRMRFDRVLETWYRVG